jgi:hypothetical protein
VEALEKVCIFFLIGGQIFLFVRLYVRSMFHKKTKGVCPVAQDGFLFVSSVLFVCFFVWLVCLPS